MADGRRPPRHGRPRVQSRRPRPPVLKYISAAFEAKRAELEAQQRDNPAPGSGEMSRLRRELPFTAREDLPCQVLQR
jgi:hypothetical protein